MSQKIMGCNPKTEKGSNTKTCHFYKWDIHTGAFTCIIAIKNDCPRPSWSGYKKDTSEDIGEGL